LSPAQAAPEIRALLDERDLLGWGGPTRPGSKEVVMPRAIKQVGEELRSVMRGRSTDERVEHSVGAVVTDPSGQGYLVTDNGYGFPRSFVADPPRRVGRSRYVEVEFA
jgi:hypothetical protein